MGSSPERSSAAAAYHGESGRLYHEVKRALDPRALAWVVESRARKLQPYVRPTDVLFEFGAGSGWNLAGLRCARRIGSDTAEFLKERIIAAGAEFVSDLSAVPSASVDVMLFHHSLEHVLEPVDVLSEAKGKLKSGGRMVVYVPWERESKYRRYDATEPNHHLYSWNAQTIGNLLQVCGFRISGVRTVRYGYERFCGNLAARSGTGRIGYEYLRRTLMILKPLWEVEAVALLNIHAGHLGSAN